MSTPRQFTTAQAAIDFYETASFALHTLAIGDWTDSNMPASESETLHARAALRGQPCTVSAVLQRWDKDEDLLDIDYIEFDAAPLIRLLDDEARAALANAASRNFGSFQDHGDALFDAARKAGLVSHDGPTELRLEEPSDADFVHWLVENPAWHEDGTTPHPTEGWVTRRVRQRSGVSITDYFDADGLWHRDGAPACIFEFNGVATQQEWRTHGLFNRADGPALVRLDRHEFHVDGEQVATLTFTHGWTVQDGAPTRLK